MIASAFVYHFVSLYSYFLLFFEYPVIRGSNEVGIVGDGSHTGYLTGPTISAGGMRLSQVSLGEHHQCGLDVDGIMWCFGTNDAGQLGDNNIGVDRFTPDILNGPVSSAQWISFQCGYKYTAAIDSTGELYTWGSNHGGNRASGASNSSATISYPQRIISDFSPFVHVSTGKLTTCVRSLDERL